MTESIEPVAAALGTGAGVLVLAKVLISNWLSRYEKTIDVVLSLDKTVAVHSHRIEKAERDINGIGRKLRVSDCPNDLNDEEN